MSVAGCVGSSQEDLVDDPDLTKQAALERILKYLERTEAELPAGMALSANSDYPGAVQRERVLSGSISCDGMGAADLDTAPQLVYVSYFVNGVPQEESSKYATQIRQVWESWGWKLVTEPTERRATYMNDDGYVLEVLDPEKGTIAVTGETPCIAAENFTGSEDVPRHIGKGEF